jgi:predicted dehydrogenase
MDNEITPNNVCTVSRRRFLGGAATAGLTIITRPALAACGFPPGDRLTLACIGVGAQGTRVMLDFLKMPEVQVVAVCDVNRESSDYSEWGTNELRDKVRELLGNDSWGSKLTGCTAGRDPARNIVESYYGGKKNSGSYKGCHAYTDFRELLDKEKGLDAVAVCTPDHWHAPISIAAMKQKKHVYCQKPMTRVISEARRMAEVAAETGVATQVAIGNSASEATRQLSEWIAAGAVGPVRRVENWSSRPFWPQGLNRPEKADPIPDGLDWNLWLGPAPERPFSHVYLPFVWRGWYDFGAGAIGDMGNYSFDTIFRALKLGAPAKVEASSTQTFRETFPAASIIRYEFPARGEMAPVTLTWYDGKLKPPRPPELEDDKPLGVGEEDEGLLFIGDRGTIMCGFEGNNPRLIPDAKMRAFEPPPKTLPRSNGHYKEWIEAAKGGPQAAANFEFEAPVVEAVLLGNVALRSSGRLVRWDRSHMKVIDASDAQAFVTAQYRGEWAK